MRLQRDAILDWIEFSMDILSTATATATATATVTQSHRLTALTQSAQTVRSIVCAWLFCFFFFFTPFYSVCLFIFWFRRRFAFVHFGTELECKRFTLLTILTRHTQERSFQQKNKKKNKKDTNNKRSSVLLVLLISRDTFNCVRYHGIKCLVRSAKRLTIQNNQISVLHKQRQTQPNQTKSN